MPGLVDYITANLFGGAITVSLPKGFADVSDLRQVPDNQEVFLDKTGFSSIIFDITERLDRSTAADDEAALRYHFADIVAGSGDRTNILSVAPATFSHIPSALAMTLFAIQETTPESTRRTDAPDFTAVFVTVLRLEEQKTDIVISINVPQSRLRGEYEPSNFEATASVSTPLIDAARSAGQQILESFDIKNWSLFVNE